MANYNNLKTAIQSVIKANGQNEITGPILQAELISMITELGAGYQFMGVAYPSTNPGTPDARVFYIAYVTGQYNNFGGIAVSGLCVLKWDLAWSRENIPVSGGGADFSTEPDDLTLEDVGGSKLLKFANRTYNQQSPNGKGYKIVRKDATFAEQVTDANTIYEIRYEFDLNGGNIIIPSNSELNFCGGSLQNGNVNLNGVLLSGDVKMNCEIVAGNPARNSEINVDWFGAKGDGLTDDSRAILNAIKALKYNGATLSFGAGKTYIHGDGLNGENGTGNSYVRASEDPSSDDYKRPNTNYPANIGRDIMFRFLGFDNLTINGNGASIVSNEYNGICKHNAIFFFGACDNLTVKNLVVDAKNKERRTNTGIGLGDYSPGGMISTTYSQMRNHEWVDSTNSGYSLRGNFTLYSCTNVKIENVTSINSMMDGFYNSSCDNNTPSFSINFHKCIAKNSQRLGIGTSLVRMMGIYDCDLSLSGLYNDGTLMDLSGNTCGFSSELESTPTTQNDFITGIVIDNCRFGHSVVAGGHFGAGTRNCVIKNSLFENSGFGLVRPSGSNKAAEFNKVLDCVFYNSNIGIQQNGAIIKGNRFIYDKNFTGTYVVNYSDYNNASGFNTPIQFVDNIVDTDLTDVTAESTFSNYVFLQGFINVIGNTFRNLRRPSAQVVSILGIKVCDNYLERTNAIASTNNSLRTNYALQLENHNYDFLCIGNKLVGFGSGNVIQRLDESFKIGSNKIIRSLPFDSSGYGNERWYSLPRTSGLITVTTLKDFVYRIHIFYGGSSNVFRGVYYEGANVATQLDNLPAIVYYKGSVCYLKISLANNESVTYEQYARRTDTYMDKGFALNTINAPDVSTFTPMVNLCAKSDNAFAAIDAILSGKSIFYDGKPRWFDGTNWVDADGFKSNVARSGATTDRPTASAVGAGFTYFDTDLGKMIVSNGTAWVNMDGTALS